MNKYNFTIIVDENIPHSPFHYPSHCSLLHTTKFHTIEQLCYCLYSSFASPNRFGTVFITSFVSLHLLWIVFIPSHFAYFPLCRQFTAWFRCRSTAGNDCLRISGPPKAIVPIWQEINGLMANEFGRSHS